MKKIIFIFLIIFSISSFSEINTDVNKIVKNIKKIPIITVVFKYLL